MKVHDPMCLTFVHGVLVGDGLVVAGEELHLTGTATWEGRKEGREEDRNEWVRRGGKGTVNYSAVWRCLHL